MTALLNPGSSGDRPHRATRVWVVGTTRNEADIIATMVRHHLSQGVDGLLLLDNGSTDGTQDVLADLARVAGRVAVAPGPLPPAVAVDRTGPRSVCQRRGLGPRRRCRRVLVRNVRNPSRGARAERGWCPSRPGSQFRAAPRADSHHPRRAADDDETHAAADRTILSIERLVSANAIAFVEHLYAPKFVARACSTWRSAGAITT